MKMNLLPRTKKNPPQTRGKGWPLFPSPPPKKDVFPKRKRQVLPFPSFQNPIFPPCRLPKRTGLPPGLNLCSLPRGRSFPPFERKPPPPFFYTQSGRRLFLLLFLKLPSPAPYLDIVDKFLPLPLKGKAPLSRRLRT